MNTNTALFLLDEELVVINVTFLFDSRASNPTDNTYTYCARRSWLPKTELKQGDLIIVPVPNKTKLAYFHSFGDELDLNLDNDVIQYKYIIGVMPSELLQRHQDANDDLEKQRQLIARTRINTLRATIKNQLLSLPNGLNDLK